MKFFCGIDLSARDCHLCVIDEQLKIVIEQKLRNDLAVILLFSRVTVVRHLSMRNAPPS